jgi:hypothetical protein
MKKLLWLIALILIPIFARIASADLTNGLVAYYPFNGNANDAIGNSNGAVYGATLTSDRLEVANSAYSFDGIDDYIRISHNSNFNINPAGFTVAGWFKANSSQSGNYYALIDKSHGDNVSGYDDHSGWAVQGQASLVIFAVGNGTAWYVVGSGTPILDNQWHHFVSTFDGVSIRFYLDGVLSGTTAFSGAPLSNNRDLFIGKHYALGRYFRGTVDEICI